MQKVINHLPLQDECSGIAAVKERTESKALRVEKRGAGPSALGVSILALALLGAVTILCCVVALGVVIVRHFLTH
jgi:hypothetical protein